MTPSPETTQTKLVPIDKVKLWDRSLQVRGGIDPEKVERYREIIRENGGYMDPCRVFTEEIGGDGPHWIADGFHRIAAYEAEGALKIPFTIKVGDEEKAFVFALGENGHHGAQMTNAEKRHAANMAVVHPIVGNKTDVEIAKLIGCSASLVSDCRRGETPKSKSAKAKAKQEPKFTLVDNGDLPDFEPDSNVGVVEEQASSPRETESSAPRSATASERKPKETRPTREAMLKQIDSWVNSEVVDEADIIALFETANAGYRFVAKAGSTCKLRIVGKNGKAQCEAEVLIKDLKFESLTVKYEGEGKIQLVEA